MDPDHFSHVIKGLELGTKMAVAIIPLIRRGIHNAKTIAQLRKFNALYLKAQTPGSLTEEGDYKLPMNHAAQESCVSDIGDGFADMEKAKQLYPKIRGSALQAKNQVMLKQLDDCLACMKSSLAANKTCEEQKREQMVEVGQEGLETSKVQSIEQ